MDLEPDAKQVLLYPDEFFMEIESTSKQKG